MGRTLNTLHTEKFLQQARVTGEQVREATCHGARVPVTSPTSLQQHLLYGPSINNDWETDNQDRDSTGSRSPQSSDSHVTNHSYSYEDMRRSPIGSVSSSESLGSSETFSKLSVNDLKIHGVGSVLLNALTSPAMTAASVTCPLNRKRDISRCTSESNISVRGQSESGGSGGPDHHTPAESGSQHQPSVHSSLASWTVPVTVVLTHPRRKDPKVQTLQSAPAPGPAWRTR